MSLHFSEPEFLPNARLGRGGWRISVVETETDAVVETTRVQPCRQTAMERAQAILHRLDPSASHTTE